MSEEFSIRATKIANALAIPRLLFGKIWKVVNASKRVVQFGRVWVWGVGFRSQIQSPKLSFNRAVLRVPSCASADSADSSEPQTLNP